MNFRYSPGMSWAEKVWGHFYKMDVSGDGHVDSSEMLDYLTANQAQPSHSQVKGANIIFQYLIIVIPHVMYRVSLRKCD